MAVRRIDGKKTKKVKKVHKQVVVPKRKLRLEYVPIDELKSWKKNPRRNDEAAEKLVGLLGEYGFINPIIATPDKVIRAGHTRLKAASKTDLTELPVIYVDFGSEDKAEMFAIADNRASEWAEWDEDMLVDLLGQRKSLPDRKMAKLTGFEVNEIEGLREGWIVDSDDDDAESESKTKDRKIRCPYCSKEFKLDE